MMITMEAAALLSRAMELEASASIAHVGGVHLIWASILLGQGRLMKR